MKLSKLLPAVLCVSVIAGCAAPSSEGCRQPNVPMAFVGGVAGGLLGGQIGAGLGQKLAIAAGAGTGAVLGSRTGCS